LALAFVSVLALAFRETLRTFSSGTNRIPLLSYTSSDSDYIREYSSSVRMDSPDDKMGAHRAPCARAPGAGARRRAPSGFSIRAMTPSTRAHRAIASFPVRRASTSVSDWGDGNLASTDANAREPIAPPARASPPFSLGFPLTSPPFALASFPYVVVSLLSQASMHFSIVLLFLYRPFPP